VPHHKDVLGVEVYVHAFLTLSVDGDKWSAARPGHFTLREELTKRIEQEAGWAPEPVWTRWRREKNPYTSWEWNLGLLARNLVIVLNQLPRLIACNMPELECELSS